MKQLPQEDAVMTRAASRVGFLPRRPPCRAARWSRLQHVDAVIPEVVLRRAAPPLPLRRALAWWWARWRRIHP